MGSVRAHRAAVVLASALGLAAGLLPAAGAAPADSPAVSPAGTEERPVVRTDKGAVRGVTENGSHVYRGIPFAAPPVGKLRWRDPRPAKRWHGVRDAATSAPACAQQPGELPEGSKSEDCLYLNVTTPTEKAPDGKAPTRNASAGESTKPRPVVVWVPGGGFFMGAGSNYDAHRMANRGDVVVVTVNYRLGIFGYFGHPGLRGSGAFGLRDQQAALSWVRRNAASFGGDPHNVTLAGESAGAMSTCAQLTSPGAAGLFDRAISQSGSCNFVIQKNLDYRGAERTRMFQPRQVIQKQGRQTARELGCARRNSRQALRCLRELPVDDLMPKLMDYTRPAYDTAVLPREPAKAVREGAIHHVPVLTGTNRDEGASWAAAYDGGKPMSEATYREVFDETFGADADAVRREYPRSAYDSAALAWAALVTDREWACPQYASSRQLSRNAPVFHYEFADPNPPAVTPEPPGMPLGANHGSELWSLFDLGGRSPDFSPEQARLSERMIDYWTGFARTGNPNGADRPAWKRMRPEGESSTVQSLAPGADGIGPVDLAADHHCEFWAGLS